jgi:hypothetical protein
METKPSPLGVSIFLAMMRRNVSYSNLYRDKTGTEYLNEWGGSLQSLRMRAVANVKSAHFETDPLPRWYIYSLR